MSPGSYDFAPPPPPPPPSNGPGGYTGHNNHGYSRHNPRPSTSGPRSRDRGHYNPGPYSQAIEYHQPYVTPNEPVINGTHMNNGRHTGNGNSSSNGSHPGNGYYNQWTPEPGYGSGPGNPPAHSQLPSFTLDQPRQGYGHQGLYSQPSYGSGPATQAYHSYAQDSEQPQWNGPTQGPYESARSRGIYHVEHVGPKPFDAALPAPVSSGYGSGYTDYHDPRGYAPVAPPGYGPYPGHHHSHQVAGGPHHRDANYNHVNRRGRGGGGFRDQHNSRAKFTAVDDKSRARKAGPPTQDENVTTRQDQTLAGKKKKRKTDPLGLVPEDDAEDDYVNEEARLVKLLDGQGIQISDMTRYLVERKARFPTQERIEARKLAAEKAALEADADQQRATALRRELRKLEKSIKRKRETGDNGDDQRASEDGSSDDEKLGVGSNGDHRVSKPAIKKADVSNHCKYYATGGTCGKKGKCRFVHDPEVRAGAIRERDTNGGRLTIAQRLALNDKNQEDLCILESIQHLRDIGLAEQHRPVMEKNTSQGPVPGNVSTKLLPVAPATLPPPPARRETGYPLHHPPPSLHANGNPAANQHYQGWNLKPYGNGNGGGSKSDNHHKKVLHK